MRLTKRTDERASAIQRSTMAAWYMAVCFAICMAGGIWLASLLGVIDFGDAASREATKVTVKEAAAKAAAQQVQARKSAEEEARNIAEDSTRLIRAPLPGVKNEATPSPASAPDAPDPAPSTAAKPPPQ